MSLINVDRIRHLISAATLPHQHRGIEQDRIGTYQVTTLSRPGFAELVQLARQNPSALIAVLPSTESTAERLVVCEALSEVSDPSTIPFWKNIVEHDADEEALACAAIGLARQRQVALLEELEASRAHASSPRLLFHLGIARLLLDDPRGVDYLVEMLRQETVGDVSIASKSAVHGPTMRFIALSILQRILPKGPGEEISQWSDWWSGRRDRYQRINSSVLPTNQLAYVPPLSAFTGNEHRKK
jgi:hypothetical protein